MNDTGSNADGASPARSLWMAGAVGIACGLKLYLLAGAATAMMLIVLAGLGRHHSSRARWPRTG